MVSILTAVATAGVAWGGARSGVRDLSRKIHELQTNRKEQSDALAEHAEADHALAVETEGRLAGLEALIREVHSHTVNRRRWYDLQ
jgi:hypothetical protein